MRKHRTVPRLLLIGPLPPPIGGASVLFKYLADDLASDGRVDVRVIDISRGTSEQGWMRNFLTAVRVAAQTLVQGPGVDVISFHANLRGRLLFGPVAFLLSRLLRKPLVNRAFGGAFDQQYQGCGRLWRWVLRNTYFQAEVCLVETRRLAAYFEALPARRVGWFPNYTRAVAPPRGGAPVPPGPCERLVFLGRVCRVKGIEVILNSMERLHPGITIDLYGPLEDGYTADGLNQRGLGRVRYLGVLDGAGVQERLFHYNALVLPTFHPGEGYPGVILEAFAHGVPVIATRWLSIPEIVDDSCGILVEPGSSVALAEALNRLHDDPELWAALRRGSRKKALEFSDRQRTEQFVSLCETLASGVWPGR